tara:strand:- start:2388 stop:2621 length:234 start_codon:yes stop_codon:yes gene_type:complete
MNMSDPNSNTSAAEYSLIIGGVAAALASIIYSLKHVKNCKSCCGLVACQQETDCPKDGGVLEPEKIVIHKYIEETLL